MSICCFYVVVDCGGDIFEKDGWIGCIVEVFGCDYDGVMLVKCLFVISVEFSWVYC